MKTQKPYLIGIAGPSSSGKSIISHQLVEKLSKKDAVVIGLDSYYHDLSHIPQEELEEWNFDCPDSLDKTLLIKQITTLIKGQVVVKPNYHYYTHVRISQGERVYPKAFIIVEGLFALYWAELRNLYRLKVFIDASNDSCLERRLQRDIKERGFSPEFIRHQFKTTVLPMYRKYIQSTRKYADIILNGEKPVEQAVDRLLDICV